MNQRSLKLRIFFLLLMITISVIISNRYIAQKFLADQLRDDIHADMGHAMSACSLKTANKLEFLNCFRTMGRGSVISYMSDYYVLCHPLTGDCPGVFGQDSLSTQPPKNENGLDYWRGLANNVVWLSVRPSGNLNGAQVWLKQSDADIVVQQMWALRDRNLFRVVPFIFLMLLGFTWLAAKVFLKPIKTLERSISTLNADNLATNSIPIATYQEFQSFVNVYENLRSRLNDSFIKARRFASDASHELRTPLTILRGNSEHLIANLPSGSALQVSARKIGDEVERLIDITEKLLLLSRADASSLVQSFKVINLSDTLNEVLSDCFYNNVDNSHVKVTKNVAANILFHCDETLIVQMIHNLIDNALRYNTGNAWVHISLLQNEGEFRLSVENPSSNIPNNLSELAFHRFYRGDESHTRHIDGLGLGLSICLETAKVLKGKLTLQTTSNQTVLVSFTAPLYSPF